MNDSRRVIGRVFKPLPEDHPLAMDGRPVCWICERQFRAGERTLLLSYEAPTETGFATVEAKVSHATCALKGTVFRVNGKAFVIERIKDGDASPFPVLSTDGSQFSLHEAGLED